MTALQADLTNVQWKDGILVRRKVNGGSTIYAGSLVALNSDGAALACPANVGSGNTFDGVAIEGTLDTSVIANTNDGDQTILVKRAGIFYYKVDGASLANTNAAVYVTDDNNLTTTAPSQGVKVGKIVKYEDEAGYAWVQFDLIDQVVSPTPRVQTLVVPFIKKTSDFDSGKTLPAGAVVTDCYIEITAAAAAITAMDVGLVTTDPNGFIAALAASGDAVATPTKVFASSYGATTGAETYGALLSDTEQGDSTCKFVKPRKNYLVAADTNVSYKTTTSGASCSGNIIIVYIL